MKQRNQVTFVLMFVALVLFGAVIQAGQSSEDPAVKLERAIQVETVDGDLEAAIKLYQEIIAKNGNHRAIIAKAMLRLGGCYEKLGQEEARKVYERLIKDFPDQSREAGAARQRLASLVKTIETGPHKPTFRQIQIPTKLGRGGDIRLSPDGQKISLPRAPKGKLWIMPLSGKVGPNIPGEPVELNTEGVGVEYSAHNWSPDGRWIAFNEDVSVAEMGDEEKKGNQGIYVVSSEGGSPKKVHENYRDARLINYRISLSPQGKTLAFSTVDLKKYEQHIFTIPVAGGVPKQLVDAKAREPVFSPDGNMIAYVEDKDFGRGGGALYVVPAQGGIPKRVADAGNASSPIWSPEGDMVAFIDKQVKVAQVHIIPLGENGEAVGERITIGVPDGFQGVDLLAGWTPDNKIGAVLKRSLEFGLYTVPTEGGKATMVAHGGYPVQPRFSPDGKQIIHLNNAEEGNGAWQQYAIAVVPAEGGQVTTLPIEADEKMIIPAWGGGYRVSPDGKRIVFAGKTPQDPGLHFHIWTLPIEGGHPLRLTEAPDQCSDMFPCWSSDGSTVAFVRAKVSKNYAEGYGDTNIYIVDSSGGQLKPLTSESDRVSFRPIAWSPDGKLMAYYSHAQEKWGEGTLNVIPTDGGKSRAIGMVQGMHVNKELAWSPDCTRIAFNGKGDEKIIKIISLEDGSIIDIETDLDETSIYHLDWSPLGDRLVFGGFKGGGREFWMIEDFLPLIKR